MVLDTPNKSRGNFMTHVRAVFCCVSKMELGLLIATPHGHIICQPAAWLRHPLIIHISYGCWLKQWETKGWSYVRSAWTVTSAIFFGGKTLVSLKFLKCDLGHRCTFLIGVYQAVYDGLNKPSWMRHIIFIIIVIVTIQCLQPMCLVYKMQCF